MPLDPNTYRLLDRYAIKYGSDSLRDPHTSVRPYTRAAAAHLGERVDVLVVGAGDAVVGDVGVVDNRLSSHLGPGALETRPDRRGSRAS